MRSVEGVFYCGIFIGWEPSSNHLPMKRVSNLIICTILGLGTVIGQDFDYSFKETYKVASPAELDLSSSDGSLDIIPSDGNQIQVFYIVRKGGKLLKIDREKLEEDFIVETRSTANAVEIIVKDKLKYQGLNFNNRPSVGFKVYVPKETMCNLATSDGNIRITGLNGNQRLKTSDGSIELAEISGSITGRTSDGDVRIRKIKGNVDIQTSDGTIELETVGGDVQASTSDGNIRLDRVKGDIAVRTSDGYIDFKEISGSFKASTSDGNIKGNVVELKKELTLRTSDGNIEVTLPGQLGLDLDIKAESIDVPFKNFTGKFDKTFVRGQSNGGGIPVVLTTSGGNVRLIH
jgi:DUF4097 and DUF4098 domain-containing protein YvlB